uniref:Uncharacterized protein n=2 Tax=Cacopsylla melanoneura TaxID=428564 RepID=A0A8D8ZHN4_9HEMI
MTNLFSRYVSLSENDLTLLLLLLFDFCVTFPCLDSCVLKGLFSDMILHIPSRLNSIEFTVSTCPVRGRYTYQLPVSQENCIPAPTPAIKPTPPRCTVRFCSLLKFTNQLCSVWMVTFMEAATASGVSPSFKRLIAVSFSNTVTPLGSLLSLFPPPLLVLTIMGEIVTESSPLGVIVMGVNLLSIRVKHSTIEISEPSDEELRVISIGFVFFTGLTLMSTSSVSLLLGTGLTDGTLGLTDN